MSCILFAHSSKGHQQRLCQVWKYFSVALNALCLRQACHMLGGEISMSVHLDIIISLIYCWPLSRSPGRELCVCVWPCTRFSVWALAIFEINSMLIEFSQRKTHGNLIPLWNKDVYISNTSRPTNDSTLCKICTSVRREKYMVWFIPE